MMSLHSVGIASLVCVIASGTCGTPKTEPTGSFTGPVVAWEAITPPGISLADTVGGQENWGVLAVEVDPLAPSTVYASTSYQGLWRSDDRGATWAKLNAAGDDIDSARAWSLAVDPTDPQVMYVATGYGRSGLWKSADGGASWTQLFTADPGQNPTQPINYTGGVLPDLSSVVLDPYDPRHLLATFHDVAWEGYADAGLVESLDGGATWRLVAPPTGFGVAQHVYFLSSSARWLVVSSSPTTGTWRTTDGGATFTRVGDGFWGGQLYRTAGALFLGDAYGVVRSTDDGVTWTRVTGGGPVVGLAGDGRYIFASTAYPVRSVATAYNPTQATDESPGTGWTAYGNQTFHNGANAFAVDRAGHVVYAASGVEGLFRLVLP